jgi:hypothetical protein
MLCPICQKYTTDWGSICSICEMQDDEYITDMILRPVRARILSILQQTEDGAVLASLKGIRPFLNDDDEYGVTTSHQNLIGTLAGTLPPISRDIILWRGMTCTLDEFEEKTFWQTSVNWLVANEFRSKPKHLLLRIRVKKGKQAIFFF